MSTVQDIEKERKRKGENKKREIFGMPPVPPQKTDEIPSFSNPALFPEHAHPVLHRRKLTKRQFSRHSEQLSLFLAANHSADAVIMLQTLIRLGDMEALKLFFKLVGLDKSAPQTVVNLQQNNNLISQGGASERTIDTLVRQLDERDRKSTAITVQAEPVKMIEAE